MLLSTPLLILLALTPHPAAAGFSSAAASLHNFAQRHSAGLARDLRVVFQGLNAEPGKATASPVHRVYCSRPDPFGSTGGGGNSTSPATGTRGGPKPTGSPKPSSTGGPLPTSIWKLQETHQGNSFFDGWNFWDLPDPTHGIVDYLDQPTAQSNNLISINSAGNAVMSVETTPVVSGNRKSVRIHSANTFTGGLFVMDAVHMPTGCGTWPAFWSNGPNWPAGGEIDIVEGVHDYTNNQATIHTNPGCNMPASIGQGALAINGTVVGGMNCAAAQTGNQGCGVRSNDGNSFGAAFNDIGGGVYAMLWDDDGIEVYWFPRGTTPRDLDGGAPQPQTWGTPAARWPATACNPSQFFYNHIVIFDTTLCGDWAGAVWGSSGIPGQETSCAARTGSATCEDFVRNNGGAFDQAYWEVKSVKIYQTSRTP